MLDLNKIYNSNSCGQFKVIEYINAKNVIVEFLATGYKAKAEAKSVRNGVVKDYLAPTIYGVGYFGVGKHQARISNKTTKSYQKWFNMLLRCYCPRELKRKPSYINVSVCPEWHNFQNFADWFDVNNIDGFELDKDVLQKGVERKVYSPSTCLFISHQDNTIEAQAKHYSMIDPNGTVHNIYNMKKFCISMGLCHKAMNPVARGRRRSHKGWTKA